MVKLLFISAIAIVLLACSAMPILAQGTAPAYLYVENTNANTVTVVDLGNESVAATIDVGSRIMDVAADPAGKYVYIALAEQRQDHRYCHGYGPGHGPGR